MGVTCKGSLNWTSISSCLTVVEMWCFSENEMKKIVFFHFTSSSSAEGIDEWVTLIISLVCHLFTLVSKCNVKDVRNCARLISGLYDVLNNLPGRRICRSGSGRPHSVSSCILSWDYRSLKTKDPFTECGESGETLDVLPPGTFGKEKSFLQLLHCCCSREGPLLHIHDCGVFGSPRLPKTDWSRWMPPGGLSSLRMSCVRGGKGNRFGFTWRDFDI